MGDVQAEDGSGVVGEDRVEINLGGTVIHAGLRGAERGGLERGERFQGLASDRVALAQEAARGAGAIHAPDAGGIGGGDAGDIFHEAGEEDGAVGFGWKDDGSDAAEIRALRGVGRLGPFAGGDVA